MKRIYSVIGVLICVGILGMVSWKGKGIHEDKERITITAMVRDFNRDKTQYIDQLFEEYTNIKIKWDIIPPGEYASVLESRMETGELPDLFEIDRQQINHFYDKTVFVNFAEYLAQMPNWKKWAKQKHSIYYNSVDIEGNIYCLDSFNTRGTVPCMPIYRKDIFEKGGVAIPRTIEELYDALLTLKEKYPESTPVVCRWGLNNLVYGVSILYQTKTGFYLDNKDLVYKFGPVTENFKSAIAMLQKFYAADLIDKEVATISDKQFEEKIVSGQGFFMFSEYLYCLNTGYEGDWTGKGKKRDPDFELAPMIPPNTEFGSGLVDIQESSNLGHYSVAINSKSKYVDEIVKLLDYQLSEEIINLVNWGVEGETYTVENREKKWLIGYEERMQKGLDTRSGMWVPIDVDCKESGLHPKDAAFCKKANKDMEQYAFYRPKTVLLFTEKEQEKINEIMTPIYSYCEDQYVRFIVGELNMEEDWEMFVETVTKMGYETVLQMYQEKYNKLPEEQKGLNMKIEN